MKQGMALPEIDAMDIIWYFELLGFAGKENQEKIVPIDQVGFL